jgi:hypothetical protein
VEWISERSKEVGLDFVHWNGMTGKLYFPEIMGAGAALLDYDNDGDLDLYLVQGRLLDPGASPSDALLPPPADRPLGDRLLRNDLTIGSDGAPPVLRFTDVTEEARIGESGYGMGVATGDYDNDGWIDLYVTGFGSNRMLRNGGDGTFEDVTARTGTDDPRWSTSAAFVDYDLDGWLDLYVCNYVDFRLANHKECVNVTGARDYCAPGAYSPVPDRLFHNRGDGSFEDVSLPSRVAVESGPALGVIPADFDRDGDPDLYVANDQKPNFYWVNQGDGTFRNEALLAGVAVNAAGNPEASMGVDAGDFDADGDLDLFKTNLRGETNTLYVNDGHGMFTDRTVDSGLGPPSIPLTGFGTAWFDLDNDGWLDLLTVNGAVTALEDARTGDVYQPYRERNQLFRNLGNGRFEEVSGRAGAAFDFEGVGRGAAFGDVDNDGDVDVLVTYNSGPARLLINDIGNRAHWLGLRLQGGRPPRDVFGARVGVRVAERPTLWRQVTTAGSYCSANDPRIVVGLGEAREVDLVRVEWPGGDVEEWTDVPIDRFTTLVRGEGAAAR